MTQSPEIVIGLYKTLRNAQNAMYELEAAHVPYPTMQLSSHSIHDAERPDLDVPELPESFWSVSVKLRTASYDQVRDVLQHHQPLGIGRERAELFGRDDVDRGAIAWRHYVFEPPAVTPGYPESRGNVGTTETVSTGVFAEGVKTEGNPPVEGFPDRPEQ